MREREIIYNILVFLDSGDVTRMDDTIKDLENLAKKYHIKLKKRPAGDLYNCLLAFIANKDGYNNTLPALYNSLLSVL